MREPTTDPGGEWTSTFNDGQTEVEAVAFRGTGSDDPLMEVRKSNRELQDLSRFWGNVAIAMDAGWSQTGHLRLRLGGFWRHCGRDIVPARPRSRDPGPWHP